MARIKIIERNIASKTNSIIKCEDGIFVSDKAVCVVDGATSKSNITFNNHTSGWLLKEYIINNLESINLSTDSYTFFDALSSLANKLKSEVCDRQFNPAATVIIYNSIKNEIWSYGDCQCIVNNELHSHHKTIDYINAKKRAKHIVDTINKLGKTKTYEMLEENDFARSHIIGDLCKQSIYTNRHCYINGVDLGYPVINGDKICADMIREYKVRNNSPIVLASDGYPFLKNTLIDSENELMTILELDPYCYTKYLSTKGLVKGNNSFDDRAYIRFVVE